MKPLMIWVRQNVENDVWKRAIVDTPLESRAMSESKRCGCAVKVYFKRGSRPDVFTHYIIPENESNTNRMYSPYSGNDSVCAEVSAQHVELVSDLLCTVSYACPTEVMAEKADLVLHIDRIKSEISASERTLYHEDDDCDSHHHADKELFRLSDALRKAERRLKEISV